MTYSAPLSILQVVSSPWHSGAATATLDLARALSDLGHKVRLAAISGHVLEARARKFGISFEGLRFNRRFGPVDFLKDCHCLSRLIREFGAQIVHTHLSLDHWIALAARKGDDTLLVRTFHLPRAVRGDIIHRACYAKTDGFFAVSDAIRRKCIQTAGISEDRVWTLRGAVDTDFFVPGTGDPSVGIALGLNGSDAIDSRGAKLDWTEPARQPVVGTIARLVPNRGHFVLLEAFVKVGAELAGARLLVSGRGEHRDAIVKKAKELGLDRKVLLPGFWEGDLRDILRQINVFVLQSAGSEGTGRALLEAMAYGLPCVVTASEGLDEIVEDGKSGIVVPPSNPQALSNAVLRLLRDPKAAADMGSNARNRATTEFRRDLQASRAADLYRVLLSERMKMASA